MQRRCFLGGLVGVVAGCRGEPAPPAIVRRVLGPVDRFVGERTELPLERVVVFRGDRGLRSLSLVCTHQGCLLRETGSGLTCPCHGAKFDARGTVLNGPAVVPLPAYRLAVEDGQLVMYRGDVVPPTWELESAGQAASSPG